jgi:N-acetylneuraminate synthase
MPVWGSMGASIPEHFTDTMQRTGPDIVCSMDEKENKGFNCEF